MTPRTKKILIYTGVAIIATASAIVAKNKFIRNPRIRKNLDEALKSGVGQYGTLEDFGGFKGLAYQKTVPLNLNVIKLVDSSARTYADRIDKAWGIVNDDEESVYQVFRELRDQYALSQVASSYLTNHKVPLLEKLKDKLSDAEMEKIYKIVKQYPKYTLAK